MKHRYGLAILGLLLIVDSAAAQQWAVKMFEKTSHDFGTVARGAKVEYDFVIENIYEEDVQIESVRSSCGCTVPQIVQKSLKTWERSAIKATVDTRGFLGRKDATLTVVLSKPFPAEVQLHVYVFIRGDVVVQPGVVKFGNVAEGVAARQTVQVSYAGRNDWRINEVESANPHVSAQAVETERRVGSVKYDVVVTLNASAPAGYIQDHLVLVTNDFTASATRVPVPVEGIVGSAITVRPSPLMLVVEAGQPITRQLVVQGRQPFRILAAQSSDPRLKLAVPTAAKTLHLLPVTFSAGSVPGSADATIHIETDLTSGKTLDVPVQVRIMSPHAPPTSGSGPGVAEY
jgi:hypothetical protein